MTEISTQPETAIQILYTESVELLKQLIRTPSFSKQEEKTAEIIRNFLAEKGIESISEGNNIWAYNKYFDENKPTILLNSHHDTVKVNPAWTRDPFSAEIEDGKLFGLGSNDAGASVVALLAVFRHFYEVSYMEYNLCFAATAEEETSGAGGIESIIPQLKNLNCAIIGEPTKMEMAVAEKGLLVLDCVAEGVAGHAARDEGENAIYKAMADIQWFKDFKFPKQSKWLGPVKMNVTMVQAGQQHNVIPAECKFVVDVRLTDVYSHEEVLDIITQNIKSKIHSRSCRLRSTCIDEAHPLVQAGFSIGRKAYGSPTCSDKALLNVPALKMGPGDSARSHTADEFVYLTEIEEGINLYISLLQKMLQV